ncbi:MAG: hypothetical protein IT258_17605 [Saprospiraceae bacterium]|nr:hypothetical protein [Saprospiraceae bacterium]
MKTINFFHQTPSFAKLAILLLIANVLITTGCDNDCSDDGFHDETFGRTAWASTLEALIPMGSIRLNNFNTAPDGTPIGGEFCNFAAPEGCVNEQNSNSGNFCQGAEFQFKRPCDSHIDFVIGRRQFDLNVPRVGPDSRYKIYINDINSTNLSAGSQDRFLRFSVDFESDGREIRANCYNNFFCFAGVPEFELNNLHIDILLGITAENNAITYDDVQVVVTADLQNAGLCQDNLFAAFCGDTHEIIFSNLRDQITNQMNDPSIKDFISNSITNYVRAQLSLGTRIIRRATILGESLILNIEC